jgi:thiol-disulfide isomerase/thioredoxin
LSVVLNPLQNPSRRRCLQGALATVTAAAGFSGLAVPWATAQNASQSLTGPAFVVSPWAGSLAPFDLLDITGKRWRAADLQGRPVLMNFWASWCEPCRAEMPSLQQLADLYGPDKLLVLAINFKEAPARAIRFATSTGVTLPVLLDSAGTLAGQWGVKVFPTTLMIDSRGQPRSRVQGEVDWTGKAAGKLVDGLM